MKLFVPFPNEDWSQDFIISTFRKKTSLEIVDNIYDADIIWFSAGWISDHFPQKILKSKKTIFTIHHRTPWKKKQWYPSLLKQNEVADLFHVPCEITQKYMSQIIDKPIVVLRYWVDMDDFFPIEDKLKLKRKFGVDNGLMTIGSFQRDTEGFDNKTPKLEKGPDIFCGIVKKIVSSGFVNGVNVLLGGWRRDFVINELSGNSKINIVYPGKVSYNEVNELYNAVDVYLVTSRVEGGPQALFEASSCKTPILTTKVGSFESVDDFCHCESTNEFVFKTLFFDNDVVEKNYKNMVDKFNADVVIPKYDRFLEKWGSK